METTLPAEVADYFWTIRDDRQRALTGQDEGHRGLREALAEGSKSKVRKDGWQMKEGQTGDNWIPPHFEHLFPAKGQGTTLDFVPDEAWLKKRELQITPEMEKYGIDYDPSKGPPVKRKTRPKMGLNPISGMMEPWPAEKKEK